MSCSQLDRLTGLHRGHIWQIEQGAAENPKRATVVQIAEACGCTVGWLLAGEGAPPTPEAVRAAVDAARVRQGGDPSPVASDFTREVGHDTAPDVAEPSGPVVVRDGFDQTGTGA